MTLRSVVVLFVAALLLTGCPPKRAELDPELPLVRYVEAVSTDDVATIQAMLAVPMVQGMTPEAFAAFYEDQRTLFKEHAAAVSAALEAPGSQTWTVTFEAEGLRFKVANAGGGWLVTPCLDPLGAVYATPLAALDGLDLYVGGSVPRCDPAGPCALDAKAVLDGIAWARANLPPGVATKPTLTIPLGETGTVTLVHGTTGWQIAAWLDGSGTACYSKEAPK